MRSLHEFTADAAHELRGPITAITANIASGESYAGGSILIPRECFESIDSAIAQMTRLTNDLLIIARAKRPLEREFFAVDVRALVARVVEQHRAQASLRSIVFQTQSGGAARDPGGTVSIACRTTLTGSSVVVTYTGIGISPEHENSFVSSTFPKKLPNGVRVDAVRLSTVAMSSATRGAFS